jgi:hypothetical protein
MSSIFSTQTDCKRKLARCYRKTCSRKRNGAFIFQTHALSFDLGSDESK